MTLEAQTETRIGPFAVGERPTDLLITFQDSAGTALDLSSYDTFDTVITRVDGDDIAGQGAGTTALNTDGTDGVVSYAWTAADHATAGFFRMQVWAGVAATPRLFASDVYAFYVEQVTVGPSI